MVIKRLRGLAAVPVLALTLVLPQSAAAETLVVADSGNISDGLVSFREALGDPLYVTTSGEQQAGRREINWDAVPGDLLNVDTFPAAFFNTSSPRGAVFSSNSGFRVSDSDFEDVNASYADEFDAFSVDKTFTVVGSNTLDVQFQVAGSTMPASVTGFGAVFSDVDVARSTRMEFFRGNQSLGVWNVPTRTAAAAGHSFLGVIFDSGIAVTRVRITAGHAALQAGRNDVSDGGTFDLVVMDDIVYGEPHVDTDRDGQFDSQDQRLNSDTRARVDLNADDPEPGGVVVV